MNAMTLKAIVTRFTKNSLIQAICICHLLVSYSTWAQEQVDVLTLDPVLVYEISHEILSKKDTLRVEIYNDGYAFIHYPSYMKKAGNYTVQLSPKKLKYLIRTLDSPSIKNFNIKDMGLQKKAEDDQKGVFSFVSDSSYSSFEVSRSDQNGQNKNKQKIRCPHLQYDAKHYPKIGSLNKLAGIEKMLSDLMHQPDLQVLDDD